MAVFLNRFTPTSCISDERIYKDRYVMKSLNPSGVNVTSCPIKDS